jgi:hypothetical protein
LLLPIVLDSPKSANQGPHSYIHIAAVGQTYTRRPNTAYMTVGSNLRGARGGGGFTCIAVLLPIFRKKIGCVSPPPLLCTNCKTLRMLQRPQNTDIGPHHVRPKQILLSANFSTLSCTLYDIFSKNLKTNSKNKKQIQKINKISKKQKKQNFLKKPKNKCQKNPWPS